MPGIRVILLLLVTFFYSSTLFAELDKTRYIALEEIEPGMEGYALSVYEGTLIEKFPIKVISIVKDYKPGNDAIFVMGINERFEHTGPVQGCSGSPVILDGRIAGALAFGWGFVKDPLYGVTPIAEMLEISERQEAIGQNAPKIKLDTKELDFSRICKDVAGFITEQNQQGPMGLRPLDVPVISSFSSKVCSQMENLCNIKIFSGTSAGQAINTTPGSCVPNFEAGSVICIPMVDGDIKMAATGTVTDVVGNKVYAFGHAFEAAGKAELPMSCGLIHMVVANQISSFKVGQSTQTVGTITTDASTGIHGIIGKNPPLIPFKITVDRNDNPETEIYNCTLAKHDMYTPYLIQAAIAGAALSQGDVPAEHTVEYSCNIAIDGFDDITFSNTSSGQSIGDAIFETAGPVAALMNNPFKKIAVKNIDFSIDIKEGESLADITLVKTNDTKVKPGQSIDMEIFTEKRYLPEKSYKATLEIPSDITPGRYQIVISGSELYQNFINSSRQYETMINDASSLVEVMRKKLQQPKAGLYIFMRTTQNGISIGKSPLEGLPSSKTKTLASPKRNYRIAPIFNWIETQVDTSDIIMGQHQINILVEEEL